MNLIYAELDKLRDEKKELLETLKDVFSAYNWDDPYNETGMTKEERFEEAIKKVKAIIAKCEAKP
jgi:hypothetical protein